MIPHFFLFVHNRLQVYVKKGKKQKKPKPDTQATGKLIH